MARTVFLVAILGLPVLAVLNAIWFGLELRRFATKTRWIRDAGDIERLKHAVGRQMYAALVQIALLVLPPVLFGVGLVKGLLVPSEVLLVVLPSAAVLLVAAAFKRIETRVRQLPAVDAELAEQRDAVVRTWTRRPLPDW